MQNMHGSLKTNRNIYICDHGSHGLLVGHRIFIEGRILLVHQPTGYSKLECHSDWIGADSPWVESNLLRIQILILESKPTSGFSTDFVVKTTESQRLKVFI